MSEKWTCPGCGTYSSSVARAMANDEPCPTCGLTAPAALEVFRVRTSLANEELTSRCAMLVIENDRLKARLTEWSTWRMQFDDLTDQLPESGPEL